MSDCLHNTPHDWKAERDAAVARAARAEADADFLLRYATPRVRELRASYLKGYDSVAHDALVAERDQP